MDKDKLISNLIQILETTEEQGDKTKSILTDLCNKIFANPKEDQPTLCVGVSCTDCPFCDTNTLRASIKGLRDAIEKSNRYDDLCK